MNTTCSDCGKELSLENFSSTVIKGKRYYKKFCKNCAVLRVNSKRQSNRVSQFITLYGARLGHLFSLGEATLGSKATQACYDMFEHVENLSSYRFFVDTKIGLVHVVDDNSSVAFMFIGNADYTKASIPLLLGYSTIVVVPYEPLSTVAKKFIEVIHNGSFQNQH